MPIRERIAKRMPEPQYRGGYPDLLFEGFRMRFGHVNAVFTNACMQSLAGLADPAINRLHCAGGPVPSAEWRFYSQVGLAKEIDQRKQNGQNWQFLQEVMEQWPVGQIPGALRHRIGDE